MDRHGRLLPQGGRAFWQPSPNAWSSRLPGMMSCSAGWYLRNCNAPWPQGCRIPTTSSGPSGYSALPRRNPRAGTRTLLLAGECTSPHWLLPWAWLPLQGQRPLPCHAAPLGPWHRRPRPPCQRHNGAHDLRVPWPPRESGPAQRPRAHPRPGWHGEYGPGRTPPPRAGGPRGSVISAHALAAPQHSSLFQHQ